MPNRKIMIYQKHLWHSPVQRLVRRKTIEHLQALMLNSHPIHTYKLGNVWEWVYPYRQLWFCHMTDNGIVYLGI
jgi:hypothetical protein